MHLVEPYYRWRNLYVADEDEASPFYEREYSEFEFHNRVYNFYIHPQWDDIGSSTLFLKILFVDYDFNYAVIELMGEWNDAIENDIMTLKRDVIDEMTSFGIDKFLLIGENVLNFHSSDDCYYEEWHEDALDNDGWVCLINFRDHIIKEMDTLYLRNYLHYPEELQEFHWRKYKPLQLFNSIENILFSEEVIDLQEYTLIN